MKTHMKIYRTIIILAVAFLSGLIITYIVLNKTSPQKEEKIVFVPGMSLEQYGLTHLEDRLDTHIKKDDERFNKETKQEIFIPETYDELISFYSDSIFGKPDTLTIIVKDTPKMAKRHPKLRWNIYFDSSLPPNIRSNNEKEEGENN